MNLEYALATLESDRIANFSRNVETRCGETSGVQLLLVSKHFMCNGCWLRVMFIPDVVVLASCRNVDGAPLGNRGSSHVNAHSLPGVPQYRREVRRRRPAGQAPSTTSRRPAETATIKFDNLNCLRKQVQDWENRALNAHFGFGQERGKCTIYAGGAQDERTAHSDLSQSHNPNNYRFGHEAVHASRMMCSIFIYDGEDPIKFWRTKNPSDGLVKKMKGRNAAETIAINVPRTGRIQNRNRVGGGGSFNVSSMFLNAM